MSDGEEAIQDTQEHLWLVYVPIEDLNQIMVHGANIRLSTMDLSIMGLEGAEKIAVYQEKRITKKEWLVYMEILCYNEKGNRVSIFSVVL